MEQEGSKSSQVRVLLENHALLLLHEYKHERDVARRRFQAIGAGVIFLLLSIVAFEVVLVSLFQQHGFSFAGVVFVIGLINFALSLTAIYGWGQRKLADGMPFEMSRFEFKRTIQWIEKRFLSDKTNSQNK